MITLFIARTAFVSDHRTAFRAPQGVVMAKLRFSALPALLLAALQLGCAAAPGRPDGLRSSPESLRPVCDTSVGYIYVAARIRNRSSEDIGFNLDGDRGPPFDPWYMGYRVHSSAPGELFQLVHNSGHDSVWTRTVQIAPGDTADFNVPIFGLRPADYLHYFRIELRDSKGRSYWTPVFDLCSVSKPICGCPRPGAVAVNSKDSRQVCPAAPRTSLANDATQVEVGPDCQ